jgi:hypothetical protein
VVREWTRTLSQLAQAGSHAADARATADALLSTADDLVCRGGQAAEAQTALDALVDIRQKLDTQGTNLDLSREQMEQLLSLKDQTISQTRNLAEAAENLELMADVQDQMAKIAGSFGRMRHWIVEILAFEPTFNRAMRSLQPLTELGNVRRMSASELRQVIRTMNDRHPSLDGSSPAASTAETEATPKIEAATSAPLSESARAGF